MSLFRWPGISRSEARDAIRMMKFEDAVRRYCEDNPTELERNIKALVAQVRLGGVKASGSWVFPAWDVVVKVEVSPR